MRSEYFKISTNVVTHYYFIISMILCYVTTINKLVILWWHIKWVHSQHTLQIVLVFKRQVILSHLIPDKYLSTYIKHWITIYMYIYLFVLNYNLNLLDKVLKHQYGFLDGRKVRWLDYFVYGLTYRRLINS